MKILAVFGTLSKNIFHSIIDDDKKELPDRFENFKIGHLLNQDIERIILVENN